jgi:hypothetical protein
LPTFSSALLAPRHLKLVAQIVDRRKRRDAG